MRLLEIFSTPVICNLSSFKKSQTCFLMRFDMICKLLKSASHPFSIFFQRQVECSQQIHQVILKKQTTKTRAFFFESPEVNSRCCILNACRIKEMCAGQFTRHLFGILRFNPFRCRIFFIPSLVDFIV